MQSAALQARVAGPMARARPARDILASRPFAVQSKRTGDQRETEPGKPANLAAAPSFTFGKLSLRPKLSIGRTDDPLEQEADRVAEHVMRMPAPPAGGGSLLQRKC